MIDVTINGANDAAVITGTATDSVTEESGVPTARRAMRPPRRPRCHRRRQLGRPSWCRAAWPRRYGTFSIDADGCVELHARRRQRGGSGAQHAATPLHELVTVATADGTDAGDRRHHQRRQRRGGDHRDGDGLGDRSERRTQRHGWRCDRGWRPQCHRRRQLGRPSWRRAAWPRRYGTFSIDATGAWSYTLDDGNAAVQALNTASTPLHELVTVATADGTAQVIDITINGANDAAVITGTATAR